MNKKKSDRGSHWYNEINTCLFFNDFIDNKNKYKINN